MAAWRVPALGVITSPFGPRKLAGAVSDHHDGVDLGAKRGPVYAAAAGVVRTIWQTAKGAWVVDVRHADERGHQVRTRYIHMLRSEIRVKVGQRVAAGDQIGNSGNSGTTAAHLHFEVLVAGTPIDPVPFMATRGVTLGVTTTTSPATVAAAPGEDDMIPLIRTLYPTYLDRDPDGAEVLDWSDKASNAGWSPAKLHEVFKGSRAEPGTARAAYRRFLGREASPSEVAAWTDTETIAEVWSGVSGSPEALARRA